MWITLFHLVLPTTALVNSIKGNKRQKKVFWEREFFHFAMDC